ncbi:MAG: KH domain-containing protein [Chloroflexi bacterium]|nr:KH domain-containing protein [Chloroflexota bacterium]MBI4506565.1 KH domain-containing protein [Chloroflexota bacterium]
MRDLVEYIARSVVSHPDSVEVRVTEDEQATYIELHVAPSDAGKVIGRQGRVANAMRALLRAAAARQGRRAVLDIV